MSRNNEIIYEIELDHSCLYVQNGIENVYEQCFIIRHGARYFYNIVIIITNVIRAREERHKNKISRGRD